MKTFHSAAAILGLALSGVVARPAWAGVWERQTEAPKEEPAPKVVTADEDPRIDAKTGRAKLHWPEPRLFDHLHMRLTLDFPDMGEPRVAGVEELTLKVIGTAREELDLDCKGPKVKKVTIGGEETKFEQSKTELSIHLPKAMAVDEEFTVTITYEAEFAKNKGDGLTWLKPLEPKEGDEISPTQLSPQVYSQGEAESNSTWFPCHDFPNERLTTELIVTVEDGYEVLSNGALVAKESAGEGRTRFHWKMENPHANYLVALYIAKCAIIELGGPESARPGLPMPVYCPIGSEDHLKEAMANVPAMVAFFEKYFGQAFPWEKYGEACIRTFNGGMENSSATFLAMDSRMRPMRNDLLSHELAHQWTGDLVTCNSWEHIWLNEGWATYMEALWDEQAEILAGGADAAAKGREAYEKAIMGEIRKLRRLDRGSSPDAPAMVSNRYRDADAVFTKADDPYAKGAVILHMLREKLGHEVFDRGVRLYMDRFKFATAETSDFRRALEEVSGKSLELFFDQWTSRPGIPRLSVDHEYDGSSKTLTVKVRQIQKVDGHNPAYVLDVPVRVPLDGGGERWLVVRCDRTDSSASVVLDATPLDVEVDPNMTLLASTTVHKPTAMWIRQARQGATYFARAEASEHLREVAVVRVATLALNTVRALEQGIVGGAAHVMNLAEGR